MSRVQVPAGHPQTNEAASQQRKRKARAPKARTPEPKEIITGAGQPLDLGLRRELEERLGHDFSRVRVHTDRDAALLTDLLGADAVTVGEDVFFAEGRFRPGTEDGRRLVAHELLHTVQAPHPLGALKAGRDLGAVSMPQDAVERQAEDGARSESPRPEVTRNATPGWLRYARVRADQFRTELLDPATLVDRLTAGILRSLRGDPTDATGRVRLQLTRFAPELKASVLERLSLRLPSSDHERLLELVERSERGPAETDAGVIPGPVTEPTHEPVEESDVPPKDLPKDPAGEKDEGKDEGKGEPKPEEEEKGKEKGKGKGKEEKEKEKERSEEEAEEEPPAKDKESEPGPGQTGPAGTERPQEATVGATAGVAGGAEPPTATAAAQAPGAPEQQRMAGQRRPAEGSRPKAVDRRQEQQPGPARPEQVDKLANAQDSPLARHGLLDDEKGTAEDEPLGVEAEAEKDVETPKDEEPEAAKPAGPELRPEDFVPSTDLDVSSVPTADRLDVSAGGPAAQEAPSFPEPPSTKADEIQQDRENEAEEEPEEAPEPPAPRQAEADRPAPAPETDASARREADREAESRTARDLQPDKPVEQEVGPDPEAGRPEAGRLGPETDQEAAPEPSHSDGPGRQDLEPAVAEATPADGRGRSERARPGPGGPGASDPAGASGAMAETAEPGPGLGAMGPAAEQAEAPGALGTPGAQAGPDASMEEGGGACAGAPQPTTEEAGGGEGGCGGGGAGGKEKEAEKPAPPDVSGQDPQSALATAGTLPPDQMVPTLDGVDGAVDRSVGEQHAALEADAPTAQRPSGAPRTLSGTPEESAPAQQVTERVEREGAEGGKEQKKADGEKVGGENPAADVSRPNVADDAANQVTAQDVQNMQHAVGEVPTSDPSLNTTVGTAPKVQLTGESDPRRTDKQAENLKTSSAKILGVGREDAAKPMGEDQIYPDVPGETLRGDVPGGGGVAGGRRRAGAAAAAKPGVAVVAQQERGPQIQAAVGQGQGRMGQEQSQQKQAEAEERRASQEAQDQAVAENAEAQAGERGQAAEQVRAERTQWQSEQEEEIGRADTDAAKEHGDKNKEIDTKRTDTDKDVGKRQNEDNQKIQDNRKEAEEKARKEKERKKEESSGWWGWVKSKVKAAFEALLSVVTGIFDFFRKIVNGIIEKFREFANWAIEQARKFAVELIKKLADALIAIGDVLLAAFPELREKFRNKIRQWRDQAIAKVNEWADKLKAAVNKLLDLLAAGLNKLLNLLEKGLKAAIAMVRDAVVAAIDFAQKAIAMLGQFAALVADIAPDPGGWLSKLGTAAKEGIQNHLWGAVKTAVKSWFNEKVESVLGLGKTIINVLVKGCVSMAQIGRMAWQALVQSLPAIIISIVVEKVVSMIVPAAGAIMTIIQGLMAAWGTISKIIAAFGKFFGFLKAVKSGVGAACLFAQAVAAGVVALLEFITNFLLSRLKLAAKGVGGRLKAMAQKIMKGLAKATKGPRKAAGAAVNRAKASLGRAAQALKGPRRPGPRPRPTSPKRPTRPERRPSGATPARGGTPTRSKPSRRSPTGRALNGAKAAVKGALKKVSNAARALGRKLKTSKLGKSLTNGAKRIREAFRRQRDRLRERWNKRQRQRKQNKQKQHDDRLALAVARMKPRVVSLLRKGVRPTVLRAVLGGMRMWYRLSRVAAQGDKIFQILAWASPPKLVVPGTKVEIDPREVAAFIRHLSEKVRGEFLGAKAPAKVEEDEAGQVSKVTFDRRASVGAASSTLDELEGKGRLPAPTKEKRTGEDGKEKEVTKPGQWALGWQDEGDTFVQEQGGANSIVHRRAPGQSRGRAMSYEELASEEEATQDLLKSGRDYLNLFGGRPVSPTVSEQQIWKSRFLIKLTAYVETRRDPGARVHAAMLAQMIASASGKKDAERIVRAIRDFPMAALGAQSAAKSKEAWEKGKSQQVQLAELDKSVKEERAAIRARNDITVEERNRMLKDVTNRRRREKQGIAGYFSNKKRTVDGQEVKVKRRHVSGEELAEREIQFVQMWLNGYSFDFPEGTSPEDVKKKVFEHIEKEVLKAHGIRD
ncbi:DUF4157 domain-containing protein [Streptomyces syringium]|uniref:eCIS core domain-containing protein n=1 Tax=Streptomyces syringium TaxID=76729 RepID=UPI0037D39045